MGSRTLLFRFSLIATLLLISTPGVCGWTFQNWSMTPAVSELPPGTDVTASCSINFDSWMTGSTFEKDNSLVMYTDLSSPQWVVKKIEPMDNQPPVIEQVSIRQAAQVRLEGWTLSYSRKQFYLSVQLTGKTPALNQSQSISVIKLQERTSSAKTVAASVINKEIRVLVPTAEPTTVTSAPTVEMTPEEIIVVTLLPETHETPTKKVTYSPGPEPLLVTGVLAGLVCVMGIMRRKR